MLQNIFRGHSYSFFSHPLKQGPLKKGQLILVGFHFYNSNRFLTYFQCINFLLGRVDEQSYRMLY